MQRQISILVVVAATALASCGGEQPSPDTPAAVATSAAVATVATPSAATPAQTIAASRADVELAHKCRGLMSAAAAAKTALKADFPAELAAVDFGKAAYWDRQVGQLRAPDVTVEEADRMIAESTRVLVTREALDRATPDIQACLSRTG